WPIAMALVPTLRNVNVWEADVPTVTLPKLRELAERLSAVPVPLSATIWGLFAALSATFREAVRVPSKAGRKATCTVQLAPGASVDPQRLESTKSLGFAPVRVMPVMLTDALPVFVTVTF